MEKEAGMLKGAKIGSKWTNKAGETLTLVGVDEHREQPYAFHVADKNGGNMGTEYYYEDGQFYYKSSDPRLNTLPYDITGPAEVENVPAKITVVEKKPSVLDEAVAVAGNGAERARDYGHPYENHERIARFWNAYDANKRTPGPDTPKDVALKMVLLKIAREQNTHKRDNLVDIAGYILCAEQIVERGGG